MYSNELLEEKYKAQLKLRNMAKADGKDYFEVIEKKVDELFKKNKWKKKTSKKKGGFLIRT